MSFRNKMAAAISNDELFPAIHRVLGKRFLTCYERQLKGKEVIYRNQQILIVSGLYLEINNTNIDSLFIQKIFGINKTQLDRDMKNNGKEAGILQKKPCLSNEQEKLIIEYIIDQYNSYSPCSHIEVVDYVSSLFDRHLSLGWLDSFMKRHSNELCYSTAVPIEDVRLLVDQKDVLAFYEIFEEIKNFVHPSLVFNLDETGFSPSSLSKNYKAIIPNECKNKPCYYKINRTAKNITALVTISLDGDLLPPFIILPRKTIPDELWETGIRKGIDVEIQCSDNGYMNSTIFKIILKIF